MLRECIWVASFRCACILLLQWQGEYLCASTTFENFATLNLHTCAGKNRLSPKVFNRFSKSLPQLEDIYGRAFEWKCFIYPGILILQWQRDKFCASTTYEILPLSTCTLCRHNSCISKGIIADFRNLCLSSKILREGIWVESFICAGVLHLQWQGENFAHRSTFEILPTFNMYTVPAKILYLQWYSTDFRNLCLCSKVLRECIWEKSFRCQQIILLLQWHGEYLEHRQYLKILSLSNMYHCASKNPISPKVFNRFSKSLPQLEHIEAGHLSGKFHMRRYFNFAMGTYRFCASTTFEILLLSTSTLRQNKSNISKDIIPIFEIFASAGRCWRRAFGSKISAAQIFYFSNGKVKALRIVNIWNFATFNMYTAPEKILYLQRY